MGLHQVQTRGARHQCRNDTLPHAYIRLYFSWVIFDSDHAKSDQNLEKRGFDFPFATLVFAAPYVEFDDGRYD